VNREQKKVVNQTRQPWNRINFYLRFTSYDLRPFGGREIRGVVPKPKLNLHVQVGDLCLPQPLAILNDEELHWLTRLRSPYLTALAQSS